MSTLRRCIVRPHPFRPTQYLSHHQQNSIIYGKRIYPQDRDHFFLSPLTRSRLLNLQEEKKKVKQLPLHLEMWKKTKTTSKTAPTAPTVSFKSNSKKRKKNVEIAVFFYFLFLLVFLSSTQYSSPIIYESFKNQWIFH